MFVLLCWILFLTTACQSVEYYLPNINLVNVSNNGMHVHTISHLFYIHKHTILLQNKYNIYIQAEYTLFVGSELNWESDWFSWNTSLEICRSIYGTDLASFHSSDDIHSYLSLIKNNNLTNYDCWIGLFDTIGDNTNWSWTDGTPFDYTYWYTGEPRPSSASNITSSSRATRLIRTSFATNSGWANYNHLGGISTKGNAVAQCAVCQCMPSPPTAPTLVVFLEANTTTTSAAAITMTGDQSTDNEQTGQDENNSNDEFLNSWIFILLLCIIAILIICMIIIILIARRKIQKSFENRGKNGRIMNIPSNDKDMNIDGKTNRNRNRNVNAMQLKVASITTPTVNSTGSDEIDDFDARFSSVVSSTGGMKNTYTTTKGALSIVHMHTKDIDLDSDENDENENDEKDDNISYIISNGSTNQTPLPGRQIQISMTENDDDDDDESINSRHSHSNSRKSTLFGYHGRDVQEGEANINTRQRSVGAGGGKPNVNVTTRRVRKKRQTRTPMDDANEKHHHLEDRKSVGKCQVEGLEDGSATQITTPT